MPRRDLMADPGLALLTVAEMAAADRASIAAGTPGIALMEAAGRALYEAVVNRFPPQPTVVLCGPGNNGGDGYAVARRLARAGWPAAVAALVPPARLSGDAALAAARWTGEVLPAGPEVLAGRTLVIDALFGAGLGRPLDGAALALVQAVAAAGLDCVAVDMPSGVHGDSGAVLGAAPRCRLTVTFFRPKPGHFLLPGCEYRGELVVADIGIAGDVLPAIGPAAWRNGPGLWAAALRQPAAVDHKYSRGHVLVAGGAAMTGAARLAARAARRAGAGMVTLAAPDAAAAQVYRGDDPGIVVAEGAFAAVLDGRRRDAAVLGPGGGSGPALAAKVALALQRGMPCVLDADALTAFADDPPALFALTARTPCLLTPHEGEFARLFKDIDPGLDKLARTRAAARACGAAVLLKGADTVIAGPDGRAVINDTGTPWLATAGSGDVLAGIAGALLAGGMTPLAAGAAAAWLHGMAARRLGPGLVAEDLAAARLTVDHPGDEIGIV